MKWGKQEIERCKALWTSRDHSSREISTILTAELKRPITFSAVIARMNRCGLSHAGSTCNLVRVPALSSRPRTELQLTELEALRAYERERDAKRRAQRREREGLPPARRSSARRPIKPKAKSPAPRDWSPKSRSEDIPPSLGIPLLQTRNGQCRFICADPRDERPALCCGHPTVEGRSWCPGHHRICTAQSGSSPRVVYRNWRAA